MANGTQGVIAYEVYYAKERIDIAVKAWHEHNEEHQKYLDQRPIMGEANNSDDEHASMPSICWSEEAARENVMRAMGMSHVHAELRILVARRELQDMLEFQSKHRTKQMVKSLVSWAAVKKLEVDVIAAEGIEAAESVNRVATEMRVSYRHARYAMEDAVGAEFVSREAKKKESKAFERSIEKVLKRHVYPRLLPLSATVRKSRRDIAIQEVLMKVECGDEVEIIVACNCDDALC